MKVHDLFFAVTVALSLSTTTASPQAPTDSTTTASSQAPTNSTATASSQASTNSTSSIACNGYPELCSKLYSDVAYATTHNAYSVAPNDPAANQNYHIPTQLKDGIRALMLDAHNPPNATNAIELCHESCSLLDAGPLVSTLKDIVAWLKDYPNEVLTIFWENFDSIDPSIFNAQYDAAGMLPYVYTPPSDNASWPTLQSMIDSGKRVVNFIDHQSNYSVPWLMNEYTYVFETVFEDNSTDAFENDSTACTYDRPKGQPRPMYVLNHFLSLPYTILGITFDAPAPQVANTSNADILTNHVKKCTQTFGKSANFIAVDFYDQPSSGVNVLSVTAAVNNVTYVPKTLGDASLSSGNSSNSNNSNNSNTNSKSSRSIHLSQSFPQAIMALVVVAIFAIVGL